MENEKEYFAFISYKREDEKWAVWLQNKLEHYKLPSNLNGRTDLPKEIRPIFRDKTDLTGGFLSTKIQSALEASRYLIVICSPRAAQSVWVGKEVQTFIDLGRTDKIIPFIIGGTAYAQNPEEECFPLALLNLPPEQELLGININEMGRDAAAVKVVAQMFGLKFDLLWRRYEREQRRKRFWIMMTGIIAFLAMAGIAVWMYMQKQETLNSNWIMKQQVSRFVAEKALSISEEDPTLAIRLVSEVTENVDWPYTTQVEYALRKISSMPNFGIVIHNKHFWDVEYASLDSKEDNILSLEGNVVSRYDLMGNEISTVIIKDLHLSLLNNITFSSDLKLLATSSFPDTLVRIWDAENGCCVDSLIGHSSYVNFLSFGSSNNLIASASWDGTIRIWNLLNGTCIDTLIGHTSTINSISFSPDDSFIASASSDGTIRIWDVFKGMCVDTLLGHSDGVNFVEYSPNGDVLVSVSDDNTIRIWDGIKRVCVDTLVGHTKGVRLSKISPNGKYIASCSFDGSVRIWDIVSGMCIRTIDCSNVHSMTFSWDNSQIVIGTGKASTIILPIIENQYNSFIENNNIIKSVDFDLINKYLAFASDSTIQIWDFATCTCLDTLVGHNSYIESIAFSLDGRLIASASMDKTVRVWDAKTGACVDTLVGHNGIVESVAFSPDGELIASGSWDETIRIWDVKTGVCVDTLVGHNSFVKSVAFSPDGKLLVSASWDCSARVWDIETGACLDTVPNNSQLNSANFIECSSGEYLIISSQHTLKCYNVVDKSNHFVLANFNAIQKSCSGVDSDGRNIIITTEPGSIKVFDMYARPVFSMEGNESFCGAFLCPDKKHILSYSYRSIKIWNFPPLQELVDEVKKLPPLTEQERILYFLE